jgi:hypothetical protein
MRDTEHAKEESALIFVRAGALDRFAALEGAFGAEGVGVLWDRRVGDRRHGGGPGTPTERRRGDRRGPPPASWTLLDFVIVADSSPA